MSTWYEPKKEDIEVEDGRVIIYVCSDENGNIYVEIKKDLLLEILNG